MQLIIKYQDGEVRVINLHPLFFHNPEASVAERAGGIAHDLGARPYDIQVTRGMKEDYHRIIPANTPTPKYVYEVDEFLIKKQLRKEFKNVPFETKNVLT